MYSAPIKDMRFMLEQVLHAERLSSLPHFAEYSNETAEAILNEAGRFASEVLEPLNASGDRVGARWTAQGVQAAAGFREAYQRFVADGWPQLSIDTSLGGQGMPQVLGSCVEEIAFGANMAFMLCPMLGRGAIEALHVAGSAELKAQFLPKLVSGEWTGTMDLTEPQAGTDLAAIRTRAQPDGDRYRIFGQKIFITYGEHDMADNIMHLVLARIDGAPAGVKGISLFLVPREIIAADGSATRNDMRCVSIEHKLGIHASPTCVMAFGDREGAIGYLLGEANRGLEYMFVMMNAARLAVGVQGIGMSERALQQASAWAHARVQGRPITIKSGPTSPGTPATIHEHPDVRRMLLTLRSGVEALRALGLYAALQLDLSKAAIDATARAQAQVRVELLIPIVKAWSTERGIELASLAMQVHGGMGYIEETGVAQTYRDVRIAAIYEGTTGIQANDLLGRKLGRDGGLAMRELLMEAEQELQNLRNGDTNVNKLASAGLHALADLRLSTEALLAQLAATPAQAYAVAVPYLMLCGYALGGWLMVRAAAVAQQRLSAGDADTDFLRAKLQTVRFYVMQTLPQAMALAAVVQEGGASVAEADADLI